MHAFFQRVKVVKKTVETKGMNRLLTIMLLFSLALGVGNLHAQNSQQGVKVIVIDAGHGGYFPGARYGGYAEKNINLQMALKLGAMIEKNMPQIKVVYTRKSDKHFSENLRTDLQARADIANNAGGDLFISIHANAHRNTGIRGVETLIMGESELETSENEAILFANNKEEFLDMSDKGTAAIVRAHIQNMQFTYGEYSEVMARLVQKHYANLGRANRGIRKQPLRVLYATDMPSILTEIGFMSNSAELKYITSEKGQQELVAALYKAVKEYVDYVRGSVLVEPSEQGKAVEQPKPQPEPVKPQPKPQPEQVKPQSKPQPKPQPKPAVDKNKSVVRYAVQVMASKSAVSTKDSRFGSYKGKVRQVRAEGAFSYKYCVGDYADRKSAQAAVASVRKTFPQAFVIAVKDGKVVTNK